MTTGSDITKRKIGSKGYYINEKGHSVKINDKGDEYYFHGRTDMCDGSYYTFRLYNKNGEPAGIIHMKVTEMEMTVIAEGGEKVSCWYDNRIWCYNGVQLEEGMNRVMKTAEKRLP